MSSKPKLITSCVANQYAAPWERIVEFSNDAGHGGLISLRNVDGGMIVEVYRTDPEVRVMAAQPAQSNHPKLGATLAREQLDAWAGTTLTDAQVERLTEAIPHSSIPDAISAILAGMDAEEDTPES